MSRAGPDAALLLDKPSGPSSNAVLQAVKRLYGAAKAGHAGTLDPLASGLLVVLFGEATKFAGPLLDDDKEYVATLALGATTTTGDAEGSIVERRPVALEAADVERTLGRFRGELAQVPPMHSALKRGGVPLYRLARRGERVERAPRRVTIGALELVALRGAELELRVRCSKGTYVRTLAEDIGAALGTGAHLRALRRTGSGAFRVDAAATPEALAAAGPAGRAARLIPPEALLAGLPRAELDAAAEALFRHGRAVEAPGLEPGTCGVYAAGGALIGLGDSDGAGRLRPARLTAAPPAAQAAEKHR